MFTRSTELEVIVWLQRASVAVGQISVLWVNADNNPMPRSVHEKIGPRGTKKGTSIMLVKKSWGNAEILALKIMNVASVNCTRQMSYGKHLKAQELKSFKNQSKGWKCSWTRQHTSDQACKIGSQKANCFTWKPNKFNTYPITSLNCFLFQQPFKN